MPENSKGCANSTRWNITESSALSKVGCRESQKKTGTHEKRAGVPHGHRGKYAEFVSQSSRAAGTCLELAGLKRISAGTSVMMPEKAVSLQPVHPPLSLCLEAEVFSARVEKEPKAARAAGKLKKSTGRRIPKHRCSQARSCRSCRRIWTADSVGRDDHERPENEGVPPQTWNREVARFRCISHRAPH